MNKIPKSVWILLGVLAAIYAAWSIVYPFGTLRYRMTVSVETPEGIRTGSAVRKVYFGKSPQLLGSTSSGSASVKGEAIVVDLDKRGVLFALMRGASGSDYGHQIVFDAFPTTGGPRSAKGIRYYRSLKNAKATLTPTQYPMFVRFRDLNDPKTVENVLEMERDGKGRPIKRRIKADHFEEMFGTGVKLKEVIIEMTDEQVTTGVQSLLSWLPDYYNKRLDGDRFGYSKAEYPLANSLSSGTFSTEAHHGR